MDNEEKLVVGQLLESLRRPVVIDSVAALALGKELLQLGHVVVLMKTPDKEDYISYAMNPPMRRIKSADYWCLMHRFHLELYDFYHPQVEALRMLNHERVVTVDYLDFAEPHARRIADLVDVAIQLDGIVYDE